MQLRIESMWSPDLADPDAGLPRDTLDFDVFVQLRLTEVGKPGTQTFQCRVCSPDKATGEQSLVLRQFDWAELKQRLETLLRAAEPCPDWDSAIRALSPHVQYSDGE